MSSPVITIYKNGDLHYTGKRLVVNPKEIRTFENFLDKVTQDTQSSKAVRSIRTPNHGTEVESLEKLKHGGVYVALGREKFRSLQYDKIHGRSPLLLSPKPINTMEIKPVSHSKISAASRYQGSDELLKNRIIYIHRNGDDKEFPMKLLVAKRTLESMERILQYVADNVWLGGGPVGSLFTMEGLEVLSPNDIRTGSRYVAAGFRKPFIRVNYRDPDDVKRKKKNAKRQEVKLPIKTFRKKKPAKLFLDDTTDTTLSELDASKEYVDDKGYRYENSYSATPNSDERAMTDFDAIRNVKGEHASDEISEKQDSEKDAKNQNAKNVTAHNVIENKSAKKKDSKNAKSSSSKKKTQDRKQANKSVESNVQQVSSKVEPDKKSSAKRKLKKKGSFDSSAERGEVIEEVFASVSERGEVGTTETAHVVEEMNEAGSPPRRTSSPRGADLTSAFQASGQMSETALPIKDSKETSVEKLIDQEPAQEVEEEQIEVAEADFVDQGKEDDVPEHQKDAAANDPEPAVE